jgi:pimeloyl-ACP methyl ester carboxylesterase
VVSHLTDALEVDGARIRYGTVGAGGNGPDLVLIHGNGAHHLWWAPVMEHLRLGRRLVMLDLSGHGDSSHRPEYRPSMWEAEVLAVMQATGSRDPVLVGHSMGGRVGLMVASNHPDKVSGLVTIDASVRPPERYRDNDDVTRRHGKVYGTREEIVSRFRLLPAQPLPAQPLPDELIDYAIAETPEGWVWKYDPEALKRFRDAEVDAMSRRLEVPTGFVYGSESVVVDDQIADYFARIVPAEVWVRRVEGAHHHVILDQPEESATIIETYAAAFATTARSV